jgi:hypothetical protein
MRRKNRKWVALGIGLYLLVMWSAFRWSVHLNQLFPERNIFLRLEHEAELRNAGHQPEEKESNPPPSPTGEARLSAAGPAYVAARYDATHVAFIVVNDTESRFSQTVGFRSPATPKRIGAPAKPAAPLAGMQELWEPDAQSLHFLPEIIQKTRPGESWVLSISPESTIPAVIDRVVIAPVGCSLALGFLASVPAEQQHAFADLPQEYFIIRRNAVESADPAVNVRIGELADWKRSAATGKQIEEQLNARMKQELGRIDARLIANANSPEATARQLPIGDARPRLKEWLHADKGLLRDEGALEYDLLAFRLTPDGAPRLFVRARWNLARATAFLMTAWFRADSAHREKAPSLLWDDVTWSEALRSGEAPVSLGERLDFQTILNLFDADHDGWAELLIYSHDGHPAEPSQSDSTSIGLYLYTDKGLVPLKTAMHRTNASADSCLDP